MKPKSKIDSKLANLEKEARPSEIFRFQDRGEKFQKSNSRLPPGETAVSRTASLPHGRADITNTSHLIKNGQKGGSNRTKN